MIRTVVVASPLYQIESFLRASLSRGELRPEAHTSLAPSSRRARQPGVIPRAARPAAALVLLYPMGQRVHLILTRRAGTLDQHAGQISLPGGALNELDVGLETIEAAALRESYEEVGLDIETIRVLGRLTPLYIPVSNFALHPVVGISDHRPTLLKAVREVACILEVSLSDLRQAGQPRQGIVCRETGTITVPFYEVQNERVWGATAMILSELLSLVPPHWI